MCDADWSDYGLRRLFDQTSCDFLPIEDQIKFYKTRDLQKSKAFATAKRIWGPSRVRRRVHIAPPMEGIEGRDVKVIMSEPPLWTNTDQDNLRNVGLNSKASSAHKAGYKERLKSRMELRKGLESMGLGEGWLSGKSDLTELEQRVLERISKKRHSQRPIQDDSDFIEARVSVTPRSPRPKLVHELPEAVGIIAHHLSQRRLRMVDLFSQADKDKSWTITRHEFRDCIKEANIPLSDVLLNELVDILDSNGDDVIDFREFARGIKSFNLQERRKLSMSACSQVSGLSLPDSPSPRRPQSRIPSAVSDASRYSHASAALSDSSRLSVPPIDITERRTITPDEMIEKRKRERYSARGRRKKDVDKIRTGNRNVDSHSRKSTLGEENGLLVDSFREDRLKEYYKLCKLCEERDIKLTPELLEKALLYPGDKPHRRIRSKICIPGPGLLSTQFAETPTPAEDIDDVVDNEKVLFGLDGEPVIEFKHSLPRAEDIRPRGEQQNLSTGKALVRSKVDSWLTYEEYVRLTSHLKKRYVSMQDTEKSDADPFWPGHLLDKLQFCMDGPKRSPADSLYRMNYKPKRVYSDHTIETGSWLISDAGYVNNGNIEGRKCYTIDWK